MQDAGFAFDPDGASASYAMDSNRYMVWQLPYETTGVGHALRPTIKIELNHVPLRRPPVMLRARSFVAEAFGQAAELAKVLCVGIVETAAEKLASLTRRTATELAGAGRGPDETLVRHIYDLHMLGELVDGRAVAALARVIAEADALEFANQFPAYAADIEGETRRAIGTLRTGSVHRARYDSFILSMVYGEKPEFDAAFASVAARAEAMFERR